MNAEPVTHTPGPWRYFELRGDRKPHPCPGTYFRIAGRDGFSLDGRGFSVTGSVEEADARLMAAAPDLLAALQQVLDAWQDRKYGSLSAMEMALLAARAAIAKATTPEPPKEPA